MLVATDGPTYQKGPPAHATGFTTQEQITTALNKAAETAASMQSSITNISRG